MTRSVFQTTKNLEGLRRPSRFLVSAAMPGVAAALRGQYLGTDAI
jgi:hypothetical protein